MRMSDAWRAGCLVMTLAVVCGSGATSARQRGTAPPDAPQPVNFLSFAQGAVPVAIGGAGAKLGANYEHAVRMIDGDVNSFSFVNLALADTDTEFVYELPAATTFTRFAVPEILETPSPGQTFTRLVEVHGSSTGPAAGYALLASATLKTHTARGQVTELQIANTAPVRWIKLRLVGGINVMRPQSFFEFSDIVGNGTQARLALANTFTGRWNGTGVRLELRQAGASVTGCYDLGGELTGTVTGNLLRASGIDSGDKTRSLFILSVAPDGVIRGVRSTNGSPFRLYQGPRAAAGAAGPTCPPPVQPALGCGAVIHGITFDYDSAVIRPESTPILAELFKNLQTDRSGSIVIEGHTSNEGTDAYNLRLSEQRAQAVRADLVSRGLATARIRAAGIGEVRPIATNNDENGRSLNRRVEIKCS